MVYIRHTSYLNPRNYSNNQNFTNRQSDQPTDGNYHGESLKVIQYHIILSNNKNKIKSFDTCNLVLYLHGCKNVSRQNNSKNDKI